MGRFTEVIEADAQRDAAPAPVEETASESRGRDRDISPFSMNYETESYALDAETTDRMLSVLIAVTNLL